MSPDVSFVIITMNRQKAVLRCLAELRKQDGDAAREIILVDNGSTDGTIEAVRSAFDEVIVVASPTNLGVAGARNLGFRRATGEYVVFIDDDAEFRDVDATLRVIGLFKADATLAAVGFSIVSPYTGRPERDAIARTDKVFQTHTGETAYFCGCGFALRRNLVPDQGPFWDQLIYACEDLDYSYSLVAGGRKILTTPDIVVLHWKDPNARPPGQFIYFNARNRLHVALKWLPPLAVLTTAFAWWGYLAILATRRRQLRFLWRGIVDALSGTPRVLAMRTPLNPQALRKVRALAGRIWY